MWWIAATWNTQLADGGAPHPNCGGWSCLLNVNGLFILLLTQSGSLAGIFTLSQSIVGLLTTAWSVSGDRWYFICDSLVIAQTTSLFQQFHILHVFFFPLSISSPFLAYVHMWQPLHEIENTYLAGFLSGSSILRMD